MHFRIHSTESVQIIELSGSFDAQHAPQARQWIDQVLSHEPARVVVDLREVHFLDSTGLSTLVQGMKRSREANGELRLCGLQQPVRMIFELTRLDRVFEIFSTQEEAVEAFSDN
jgi:anti-sigma B factor antagonist